MTASSISPDMNQPPTPLSSSTRSSAVTKTSSMDRTTAESCSEVSHTHTDNNNNHTTNPPCRKASMSTDNKEQPVRLYYPRPRMGHEQPVVLGSPSSVVSSLSSSPFVRGSKATVAAENKQVNSVSATRHNRPRQTPAGADKGVRVVSPSSATSPSSVLSRIKMFSKDQHCLSRRNTTGLLTLSPPFSPGTSPQRSSVSTNRSPTGSVYSESQKQTQVEGPIVIPDKSKRSADDPLSSWRLKGETKNGLREGPRPITSHIIKSQPLEVQLSHSVSNDHSSPLATTKKFKLVKVPAAFDEDEDQDVTNRHISSSEEYHTLTDGDSVDMYNVPVLKEDTDYSAHDARIVGRGGTESMSVVLSFDCDDDSCVTSADDDDVTSASVDSKSSNGRRRLRMRLAKSFSNYERLSSKLEEEKVERRAIEMELDRMRKQRDVLIHGVEKTQSFRDEALCIQTEVECKFDCQTIDASSETHRFQRLLDENRLLRQDNELLRQQQETNKSDSLCNGECNDFDEISLFLSEMSRLQNSLSEKIDDHDSMFDQVILSVSSGWQQRGTRLTVSSEGQKRADSLILYMDKLLQWPQEQLFKLRRRDSSQRAKYMELSESCSEQNIKKLQQQIESLISTSSTEKRVAAARIEQMQRSLTEEKAKNQALQNRYLKQIKAVSKECLLMQISLDSQDAQLKNLCTEKQEWLKRQALYEERLLSLDSIANELREQYKLLSLCAEKRFTSKEDEVRSLRALLSERSAEHQRAIKKARSYFAGKLDILANIAESLLCEKTQLLQEMKLHKSEAMCILAKSSEVYEVRIANLKSLASNLTDNNLFLQDKLDERDESVTRLQIHLASTQEALEESIKRTKEFEILTDKLSKRLEESDDRVEKVAPDFSAAQARISTDAQERKLLMCDHAEKADHFETCKNWQPEVKDEVAESKSLVKKLDDDEEHAENLSTKNKESLSSRREQSGLIIHLETENSRLKSQLESLSEPNAEVTEKKNYECQSLTNFDASVEFMTEMKLLAELEPLFQQPTLEEERALKILKEVNLIASRNQQYQLTQAEQIRSQQLSLDSIYNDLTEAKTEVERLYDHIAEVEQKHHVIAEHKDLINILDLAVCFVRKGNNSHVQHTNPILNQDLEAVTQRASLLSNPSRYSSRQARGDTTKDAQFQHLNDHIKKQQNTNVLWGLFGPSLTPGNSKSNDEVSPERIKQILEDNKDLKSRLVKLHSQHRESLYKHKMKVAELESANNALRLKNLTLTEYDKKSEPKS